MQTSDCKKGSLKKIKFHFSHTYIFMDKLFLSISYAKRYGYNIKDIRLLDSTLHTQCGSPITGLPKRRIYEMHFPPRGDVV